MSAEPAALATVPLSWRQYESLVDQGLLDDEDVELLDGRKVPVSPASPGHSSMIDELDRRLGTGLSDRDAHVRVGHPLALPPHDGPEPDLAVVRGSPSDYERAHPAAADVLLVVEVSDTSLDRDLGVKATVYARAGIGDYWVVDLANQRVVVHRTPSRDRYDHITSHDLPARVGPVHLAEPVTVG